MPTSDHLRRVAGSIRQDLDRTRRAFMTVDRMELTRRVRQVSGQSTTRIKAGMAADLEGALADGGLRCFPSLTETTTGDVVRIFRAGSVVGELIERRARAFRGS